MELAEGRVIKDGFVMPYMSPREREEELLSLTTL
jgi:hypothetical protein